MEKVVRIRHKAVWGSGIALAMIASALWFGGCAKGSSQGRAPVYLVIDELAGSSGATPDTYSTIVISDVFTYVQGRGTIFQDNGRVTLHVALKDIGNPASPTSPSPANFVSIDRYHITFMRADGRSTPGVDVPYAFDGAMTGTVSGSSSSVIFTLVRAPAKSEAPLVALVGGGGAQHIATIAEITFYGHDQAGNAVSVVGKISVDFADWGDPSS